MEKQINNWTEAEGSMSLTLVQNPWKKGGYIGKVKRRHVALNTLIGMIAKKHPGINEGELQAAAGYMQEEILQLYGMGYTVNILELGTLYLAPKGIISSVSGGSVPVMVPRFTPSEKLKAKAASVNVETKVLSDATPFIETVLDTFDADSSGSVTKNRVARLCGSRLKVTGDDGGVFFCPLNDDGSISANESTWIKVEPLVTNVAKKIEFYVPEAVQTGATYAIAVRTYGYAQDRQRKEPLTGFSASVTIREA